MYNIYTLFQHTQGSDNNHNNLNAKTHKEAINSIQDILNSLLEEINYNLQNLNHDSKYTIYYSFNFLASSLNYLYLVGYEKSLTLIEDFLDRLICLPKNEMIQEKLLTNRLFNFSDKIKETVNKDYNDLFCLCEKYIVIFNINI